MSRSSDFGRNRRATAAIEAAFALPVALLLVVGIFEVSTLILASWSLRSAAYEVSRYGSTGYEDTDGERDARIGEIVSERTFGIMDASDISVTTSVLDDIAALRDAQADPAGDPGAGGPEEFVLYVVQGVWTPSTPLVSVMIDPVPLEIRVPVMNEPF